jgi:hypothetical protein
MTDPINFSQKPDGGHQPMSPGKAIRLRCLDCSGGSAKEVQLCWAKGCPLYPFRLGKNPYRQPRVLTDEQRQVAAERLAKAREASAAAKNFEGDFDL